jgi:hemerythrin-like domain-containing protein
MPRKTKWSRTNSTRPEILHILHEEHTKVKGLFSEFEKLAEKESWDEALPLAMTITEELEGHTQREEEIIYPHLQEQDEEMFYEAQDEHELAKMLIEGLKEMDNGDDRFKARMKVLKDVVEHHIQEEESEVFSELRQLSKEILEECAESWQQMKGEAGAEEEEEEEEKATARRTRAA